ncbi:acyl-CoA dehydrogenase NM domain-like protein [Thelephora ganbajun]|uniref:Acyl-CoA dehydrogenase NM domain-like protein n=1 Tax=Thelephora ganbajun TaxID=370292 RepID=A0ACB6Z7I4_THEGA|nr:acyl-CoA dehydrogenase NM domain-like protein [Thelephora ganbajun]
MSAKVLTRQDIESHNTAGDLWVVIDSKVYDLTKFKDVHPGGVGVLLHPDVAGQDATEAFYSLHKQEVLDRPQYKPLVIGTIKDEESLIASPGPGEVSLVPYAEPTWLTPGYHSPYFKETHRRYQKAIRQFVDDVISPDAALNGPRGERPSAEVNEKMAELNLFAMALGPGKHLKGLKLMSGLIAPEEFDPFHELITSQELVRCGDRGYGDGIIAGLIIGLPPVMNFGSEELKQKVLPQVFSGKKFICLATSEAHAGSDVFGLQTYAKKTEDGKHWIINGTKKWITGGMYADYFSTSCKTDDGFTVILIPRVEGVETKPIKTSYSLSAGTAYITFYNVKVPVENTLGPEGGGISIIFSNFNHERWIMVCASASSQRYIIERCLKWINQRKAFGKTLANQPVVRAKIAAMISRAEAIQAWLENITYQMCHMSYKRRASQLAGQIALLKTYSTRSAQQTAQDAVQIFGGRGITQSGMGAEIEHYYRTVVFDSLLGGSEDVLADLGIRQAIKAIPKNTKL